VELALEPEDWWTTWKGVWGGNSSVALCLSERFKVPFLTSAVCVPEFFKGFLLS